MITRIMNRLKRAIRPEVMQLVSPEAKILSQREMVQRLVQEPHWERKIQLYENYEYSASRGVWFETGSEEQCAQKDSGEEIQQNEMEVAKINYGCGGNLKEGWLNVDLFPNDAPNYKLINLLEKHPFSNDTVQFGFSEDVLEHLNQAESIFFISEIYRTLTKGGVLRLSFPGLEGVLTRHYTPATELRVRQGEFEAYAFWDHIHFYSREELSLVARHIGFKKIEFVEYGESAYPELCGLDTRSTQIGLNTYVELTK